MRNSLLVFALTLILSNKVYSQDWNSWTFSFKFKIETSQKPLDFDFYLNDTQSFKQYQKSEIKLDKDKNEYTLNVNYGCVSCGYKLSENPPEIYLKVNLEHPISKILYSSIIPIYFEKSKTWSFNDVDYETQSIQAINLGVLAIDVFIAPNSLEPYEIILVKADKSLEFKKYNEYVSKQMNKLINVRFRQ